MKSGLPRPDARAADFDGASIPVLLDRLGAADPQDRADAACALGDRVRTRELSSFEADTKDRLALLLADPVPMVRLEAAIALAEGHDPRATPLLLEAMGMRIFRLDAVRALGTLGDPSAIAPLRKLLRRLFLPWADRLQAAAALCALGDGEGASYVQKCITSRRRAERAAALHFLGESRHPRALTELTAVLAQPRDPMRDVAARALGLLGDEAAIPALRRAALDCDDDELRSDIEQSLHLLGAASEDAGPT